MPTLPSPTIPGTTTLSAIQTKVRRLTRSISENQLSTADLDNYINTFTVYDFPEQLRTFNLLTTFSWWCNPFQDVYNTDLTVTPTTNPLYNFQNLYMTVHPPVYVAGFSVMYSQSPAQFWSIWPFVNSIATIGSMGDGAQATFSGVVTTNFNSTVIIPPGLTQQIVLMKNNVLFSSLDSNFNGLAMIDIPISATIGNLVVPGTVPPVIVGTTDGAGNFTGSYANGVVGQFFTIGTTTFSIVTAGNAANPLTVSAGGTGTGTYNTVTGALVFALASFDATIYYSIAGSSSIQDPNNFINYITGQYTVTFGGSSTPVAPGPGQQINSQTVMLQPSRPQSVLYYGNQFTLRPIPDQPYQINMEVFQRPTALLATNQSPELEEYWQLIAYGAARKVLQDRMDVESVQLIEPEFREQMNLCLRRTLVQYSNERAATIYTSNTGSGNGWWGGVGMGNSGGN